MRALVWPVCGLALFLAPLSLAVTGPAAAAGPTGVEYRLVIACPQPDGFTVSTESSTGCPVRLEDPEDEMGDPSLAVDPFQPRNLIVASLHGCSSNTNCPTAGSCPEGPTPRARCNQVFTTFTSTDAGASWTDNPFTPPDRVGSDAFGVTTAITIDPYGHVFVGSLYAVPNGTTADGALPRFDSVLAAQKFSSIRTIDAQQSRSNGGYHATYLRPDFAGNTIRQMWFLFNPATENMTLVWHERKGQPADQVPCESDTAHTTANGFYVTDAVPPVAYAESNGVPDLQTPDTCPAHPDQALVGSPIPATAPLPAGLHLPAARQDANGTRTNTTSSTSHRPGPPSNATAPTGPAHSAIGIAWTGASLNTTYHRQPAAAAIGPCSDSTNPVLSDGYLYIGCVADPSDGPFRWHNDTLPGTIELFRMDPSGGTPVYLGASPLQGGSPKLGVRSDGRLALLTAEAKDGQLRLDVAFGHYHNSTRRIDWSPLAHYGDKLERVDPAIRVTDANVQSVIFREYSGVVHLVLKERVQPVGVGAASLQASAKPHLRKSLVALDETYGLLVRHDLDVGNLVNRTSDPTLMQAPEVAYDDLSDSFLQLPVGNMTWDGKQLGPAYQREFFAVGDYGQVQFAEVVELTTLRGPAALPPPNPPTPIASPALSTTATQVLVPAAGLSVSTLMAVSFVLHRRKTPAATIARLKKLK